MKSRNGESTPLAPEMKTHWQHSIACTIRIVFACSVMTACGESINASNDIARMLEARWTPENIELMTQDWQWWCGEPVLFNSWTIQGQFHTQQVMRLGEMRWHGSAEDGKVVRIGVDRLMGTNVWQLERVFVKDLSAPLAKDDVIVMRVRRMLQNAAFCLFSVNDPQWISYEHPVRLLSGCEKPALIHDKLRLVEIRYPVMEGTTNHLIQVSIDERLRPQSLRFDGVETGLLGEARRALSAYMSEAQPSAGVLRQRKDEAQK